MFHDAPTRLALAALSAVDTIAYLWFAFVPRDDVSSTIMLAACACMTTALTWAAVFRPENLRLFSNLPTVLVASAALVAPLVAVGMVAVAKFA